MFDYGRMRATADRLLQRFAQGAVTLTHSEPGAVDPAQPWVPAPETRTAVALNAVVSGVGKEFVDDKTIFATDLSVLCAVPGLQYRPGDELRIDGLPVTVIRVMDIPAAGVRVATRFIVRR